MNQISTIAYVSIDVNPNGTVTMDTYTRSASDPSGFYDIRALAAAFVGFFVMEYQLKLQSGGSAVSPLTNTMFSDSTAVDQHLAAVPGSKVLLGLPYFGIDWPTTGGTLTAQATGPATPLSYGQIVSSDHPVYWNPTTDTAWTSYELGAQRHETFFEDPTSLYDAARLATGIDLAGLGIWTLGMDGKDSSMLSAFLGFSPAAKDGVPGPEVTSQSAPAASTTSTSSTTTTGISSTASSIAASAEGPSTTSSDSATTMPAGTVPSTTSITTTSTASQPAPAYRYSGDWKGQTVSLALWPTGTSPEAGAPVRQLTGYSTNEPTVSCLTTGPKLNVEPVVGQSKRVSRRRHGSW